MKKVKVKIYKDPAGQGRYVNKASQFLQKAQYGMEKKQVTEDELINTILDELTMDPDPDSVAYKLQGIYGLSYNDALDKIAEVQDILYKEGTGESKNTAEALVPEERVDYTRPNRYDYSLGETSVVDDSNYQGETGWEDDEAGEPDDLAEEDEAALSIEKTGGAVGKRKFVKKIVKELKKAAEGMQQDASTSSTILDTPVDGRQSLINNFRRGVKDLGNEYYAKEIYNKMQTQGAPQMGMQQQAPMYAQDGMEVVDIENPMHHLKAYTDSVSNIFTQPMNEVHGAGFEMQKAKEGKEQRQANKQTRKVAKDFNRAFGDIAAGYFGVPGLPNYMQVISPQMMQAPAGSIPAGVMPEGVNMPMIDLEYKKGPWWTGKREWSAKGIPMQMLMGMGAGMPNFGAMPNMAMANMAALAGNYKTYPGEVIRTKARVLNSAANPAVSGNTSLNNNPGSNSTANNWQTGSLQSARDRAKKEWEDNYDASDLDPRRGYLLSGIKDSPYTGVDEQRIWSSAYSPEQYNEVFAKYEDPNIEYDDLTDEEKFILDSSGYLTKDSNGYEYSSRVGSGTPSWERNEANRWNKYETLDDLNNFANRFVVNPATLPQEAYGGFVDASSMDPNTLARFVYGGGDNQSIAPIVAYDDNDIQSKNTEDPFMYKNGGMFKYQGPDQSQVTPGTKGAPLTPQEIQLAQQYGINDPGFNIEGTRNAIRTRQREEWIDNQMKGGNNPWAATGIPQMGQQAYNNQSYRQFYGQPMTYGYPTAPNPFQQIRDMFSIYKRNPLTGSRNDFTWLSQNGPATTMNGQVWQPPTQNAEGQMTVPGGYVQDYKYEKGPWWSGKKTLTVTNRWQDPNNPTKTSGSNTPAGPGYLGYNADSNGNNIPDYLEASGSQTAATTAGSTTQPTVEQTVQNTTQSTTASAPATTESSQPRVSRREAINNALDGVKRKQVRNYGSDIIQYNQAKDKYEQSVSDWKTQPGMKDNATSADVAAANDYYNANVAPARTAFNDYDKSTDAYEANTSNRDKRRNFRDWKQGVLSQREYGGYVPDYMVYGGNIPTYDPGGSFSGTGPFNPNEQDMSNGAMKLGQAGPCTEFEVSDPNSPCYDPNYLAKKANSATPQDFQVQYDVHNARTLNTNGIANLNALGQSAIQGISNIRDNMYNDNYMAANTTSDNREATNDLDYRGGYSGLNQRIMSKTQGRGATGFNSVVGNASFVKQGGQTGYNKGGVYDLTQEEIGAILAAGGQIEFI